MFPQPPFKTLKLRGFFETHGLKRYAAEKFRQPLQKQGVNVSVSAKHRPKLNIESRSDSMTPQSGVSFGAFEQCLHCSLRNCVIKEKRLKV